jgi:glycosyltransferase involved in cell wall biosynthesis
MIPSFNCASFLQTTLQSILDQDPGSEVMQIEVVDDHSTEDDPLSVVRSVAGERVGFFRQKVNQGVVGNLNTCINRAKGKIVHLLHGDDLVLPGYYSTMGAILENNTRLGAAFCRHAYIDETGNRIGVDPAYEDESGLIFDPAAFLGTEQRIMTPSICVRRSVYEHLGGFDSRLRCAEDWEMWMRIASHYPIFYECSILAHYRMHDHSNTGRNVLNALDLDHTRRAIKMFSRYFSKDQSRPMRKKAGSTYANSALQMADKLIGRHEYLGALNQLRVALKLSFSWQVICGVANRVTAIASKGIRNFLFNRKFPSNHA